MRAGGDKRGSASQRRARKYWMLRYFGSGKTAPCSHCGKRLTFRTIEADRIIPGGSYARHNVMPACRDCNLARSNNINWRSA